MHEPMNLYQHYRLLRKIRPIMRENVLLAHLVHKTKPYDIPPKPPQEPPPEEKSTTETE